MILLFILMSLPGLNRLNYLGMNALIAKVEAQSGKGALGVIGFPCNNFGLQEPASSYEELMNGIKVSSSCDPPTPDEA